MGRRFAPLELDEAELNELTSLASRRSTAQGLAQRARIILACAAGEQSKVVAARLSIDPDTVGKWRWRFAEHRLEGLRDGPRSGTPRTIEDARIEAVIVRTLETKPPNATHWSSRSMARASGLSVSTVQRIWRAFGLQPHRLETFKFQPIPTLSPRFATSSASTWPRPSGPSCCVSTRSRRSRRWIAANPRSPCDLVRRNAAVTTTSAMVRRRYLPPSTSQLVGSSASVTGAIAPQSSANFSMRSRPPFQTIWTFISSWTITQPTRPR